MRFGAQFFMSPIAQDILGRWKLVLMMTTSGHQGTLQFSEMVNGHFKMALIIWYIFPLEAEILSNERFELGHDIERFYDLNQQLTMDDLARRKFTHSQVVKRVLNAHFTQGSWEHMTNNFKPRFEWYLFKNTNLFWLWRNKIPQPYKTNLYNAFF